PDIQAYPYIHSIRWIGADGAQRARFDRIPRPLQNVKEREYFQLAIEDRMSSVNGNDYILQWVRSKSSGEVTAEFAKKTETFKEKKETPSPTTSGPVTKTNVPELAVVAVETELIDI